MTVLFGTGHLKKEPIDSPESCRSKDSRISLWPAKKAEDFQGRYFLLFDTENLIS